MRISATEWNDDVRTKSASATATTLVGEHEDEEELIVAFLSEPGDNAYTNTELARGVDVGNDARSETIREVLTEVQDELVDVAGDLVASGMPVDDIDKTLDELVAEEIVAEKHVETGDETTESRRLNTGEAWE